MKSRILYILGFAVVAVLAGAGGAGLRMVTEKLHTTPMQLAFQPPFDGRKRVTILVLGEDETMSSNPKVHGRSDTIMVGAIDLANNRAQAISVPRDSRVQIEGHRGFYKINAAYALGGSKLSAQTVSNLIGVPIDYYIKTNIAGLEKLVDDVGGVDLDVEKDMHYTDRAQHLYINLKKGYQHLDGQHAMEYVRFRHDQMADLWRVQRQQKFLRALAHSITEPRNWTKLPMVISEVMKCVETNMTGKDLLALARLARQIPAESVKTATLPGTTGMVGRVSYFFPDTQAIPALVDQMLKFQAPKPTVAILNGSGEPGAADRLAGVLRGTGITVTKTGNAPRMDYSQSLVMAKDPTDAEARNIADMLNCQPEMLKLRQADAGGASIVVIVGRNYQ